MTVLGVEEFALPAVYGAFVQDPLVEAVGAAFPEFNSLRDKPVTGPMGRPGDRVPETLCVLFKGLEELIAGGKGMTLKGGPGADLASPGPCGEV